MEDSLAWAEVDLDALAANIAHLEGRIGSSALVLVAKADGYGHGAVTVALGAQEAGVERVAVATFQEAWELRQRGVSARIHVLGPFLGEEAEYGLPRGVEFTLPSREHARILADAARRTATPARCHLKVDTGLNRLGSRPEEALELLQEVLGSRFLVLTGLMTHLAASEGAHAPETAEQLARFDAFTARARSLITASTRRGVPPSVELSVANSAAVLSGLGPRYDACRVGLAAYGVAPCARLADDALRPVLSVRTRVVQVRELPAGERVGYDGTWVARRPTRLAVLPAGYADGVAWRDERPGHVLVRGRRAPLVGRVSMDLCTIDVTDVPGVALGDTVTLLGADGRLRIRAEDIASMLGTIPYSVLCSFGPRVRRLSVRGGRTTPNVHALSG